jgi:SAM-dependent methyltransferase
VTGARILQWIAAPGQAVQSMMRATKPGGTVVVLDYSPLHNEWEPGPPREFRIFYEAFLAWRQANRWDNEMAHDLPGLFAQAGLIDIVSNIGDEVAERGDADFGKRTALWPEVIENIGNTLAQPVSAQKSRSRSRANAMPRVRTTLTRQTLVMRAVTARVP